MSRYIKAGLLDRQITIERTTQTQDGPQVIDDWQPLPEATDIWASKRDQRGDEVIEGLARQGRSFVIFRIYYIAGLEMKDRVIYEGQIFNIQHIAELGRREAQDIYTIGKPQ